MNVIISNKYQNILSTLDIDIIKNLNGTFEVEDLAREYNNWYNGNKEISRYQNYSKTRGKLWP